MTSTLERPSRPPAGRQGTLAGPGTDRPMSWVQEHAIGLIAASAVLLRLPLVGIAPGADEAGFLMVARQWQPGGTSLYGGYWVDRPPMLISIFRVAALFGGLVPLRLIGCLATALVVLGVAHVARRIAGAGAAPWAALTAAALCVTPMTGSLEVNGELLAAPFVVWGIAGVLVGIDGAARSERLRRRALWSTFGAGAAAVAALLVKQNFADVGLFVVAALVIAVVRRQLSTRQAARLAGAFTGGAVTCLVVVSGWTVLHGTSLSGVFNAMYPFRVEAGRVMAVSTNPAPAGRLWHLIGSWVISGIAPLTALGAWALVSRRERATWLWPLAVVLLFDMASALIGGNYWSHYLMQLVIPVSIVAGVLVARRQPGMRALLAALGVVAVMAWVVAPPGPAASSGSPLGHAVGAAAQPGDTVVTVYGHSDVSWATGLSSPYPYLWSLPLKTLDPQLHQLDTVLTGPDAPTWFVTWAHVSSWGVDSTATGQLLAE
ncbi:MAG: hypothetical protein ABI776_20025, partial [Nocardioidaceae bacterium]